jgi:hypothetical protein
MANWGKYGSSRILRGQVLQWAGSGTTVSTTFLPMTLQIRVISQINGYIAVDNTGTSISTSNFSGGTFIAANTASGDYFTVTPGQILEFTSTTTSSGGFVSVADMG